MVVPDTRPLAACRLRQKRGVLKVDDDGTVHVTTTFIMAESREDNLRFFAGRQTHRLRRNDEEIRIAHKRVDLVNCSAAFEAMAVPI